METLRTWRKRKKLTLAELAKTLGIKEATLSRIETGSRKPSLGLAQKIDELTKGRVPPKSFYD